MGSVVTSPGQIFPTDSDYFISNQFFFIFHLVQESLGDRRICLHVIKRGLAAHRREGWMKLSVRVLFPFLHQQQSMYLN